MYRKRLIWKRILTAMVCILILCLVSLLVFVKYWAGPEYARIRFERAVSSFWDGQVRYEGIRFNLLGQACFDGVSFLDNESREWAYAATISATIGNWPSRTIYLSAVKIDKLAVKLHAYTKKAAFPLKAPSRRSAKKKRYGVLRTVTIDEGSLEAIDLNRGRIHLGRLTALANRTGDHFEISSSVTKSDKLNGIVAKGTLDTNTLELDLSLAMDRDVTEEELAPLISLLNQSIAFEIAGRLKVDVGLKGKLNNLTSLQIYGDMQCKNGSISIDNKTVVADMSATIAANGRQLDIEELSGSSCGGTIQCTANIDDYGSESTGIIGKLQVKDFDLAELADKFDYKGRITKGKATLEYSFARKNTIPNTLSGKGSLSVDDADILPMSLLSKISKTIGLTDKEIQATSDVIAAFTTDGFVIEVDQAYLTNQHQAIIVEPGGNLDLQRHTIDMYITVSRLKVVGDFAKKLPVVKLFVGFSDKLTRLHIKGRWSDPASDLIRKEPIEDVTQGVVDFFLDAARSGGQLTDAVLDTSLNILNGSTKTD